MTQDVLASQPLAPESVACDWTAIVAGHAQTAPEVVAYTFLERRGEVSDSLTYAELDLAARGIARHLLRIGTSGDRVLLLFPPGLDFVRAFVGCLYAGMIAVPAYPPRQNRGYSRLKAIIDDCKASAILTDAKTSALVGQRLIERYAVSDLPVLAVDALPASGDTAFSRKPAGRRDVALLQYTSGSTGDPKGVMVTHGNLIRNVQLINRSYSLGPDDVTVGWQPLYHDMGLIGNVLQTMYLGARAVLLSPVTFLQDPAIWLRTIHRYCATASSAPNFAFDLCARKISESEKAGLDLSGWKLVVNGSEPVDPNALRAFCDAFADCGFDPGAMCPSYGMAEATLFVCGDALASPPRIVRVDRLALSEGRAVPIESGPGASIELVSCGRPDRLEWDTIVVDPDSRERLADGAIGEIWLRGPSVAAGYWNDPERTRATFQARTADGEGSWLRTGDLGFLLEGHLFVSGRVKDLIIVRGRNHHPQDIERSVQSADPSKLPRDACVAFGIERDGAEGVVVVQEATRALLRSDDAVAVLARIAARVGDEHDLALDDVVLIAPATLPKTSSGKLRRSETRTRYLDGTLQTVASLRGGMRIEAPSAAAAGRPAATAPENALVSLLASVLEIDPARISKGIPLSALGMDSLRTIALQAEIEKQCGRFVPLESLFGLSDLDSLASLVAAAATAEPREATLPEAGSPFDPFPLTDMQQAYWVGRGGMYALGGNSLHGYVELESVGIDPERLGRAWNAVVARHPMLRAVIGDDGMQRVLETVPEYVPVTHDFRGLGGEALESALRDVRDRMSHQVHALDSWPAFEIAVSLLPDGAARAHFSIDGIFLDFRSFQILFQELSRFYDGDELPPPVDVWTFRDYVTASATAGARAAAQRDLAWWRSRLDSFSQPPRLPLRAAPESIAAPRMRRLELRLDRREWAQIVSRLDALGVTPAVFMLTVYADVLSLWSEVPSFAVNVPIFNRPRLHADIDRVIGNFSSFVLIDFDYSVACGFVERLLGVRARLAAAMAHASTSGVSVLRELYRRHGSAGSAMPVVFTSLPTRGQGEITRVADDISTRFGNVVHAITQTPQVWLDNQVWYGADDVRINWDHVEDLFPAGMIEEMFRAYENTLRVLADDAGAWERTWHESLLLPFHVAQAVLAGAVSEVSQVSLYALFEDAAQRHPDAPAVISDALVLSYAQLRGAASALGARLRQAGCREGELVAVIADKGWEQIVAVMAVLHAGCAYLPVDPAQPRSRIDYLLDNGEVRFAIGQPRHAGLVCDERMLIAVEAQLAMQPPPPTPPVPLPMEALAYVIYTSGSTGAPKGVMVSHANVASMIAHTNPALGIGHEDRAFALTALHHDLSVYDIFGMLAAGGAVVMPEAAELKEPSAWVDAMRRYGVTLWNTVPALMEMLITDLEVRGVNPEGVPLRTVILGGDWIPPSLPVRISTKFRDARLLGIGGPTETTVWNIWYPMRDVDPAWVSVPYGKAITNNAYHLLDYAGRPCPRWVKGEMHCSGAGVARGYWRDPEQTASRFFPHPITGERIYRTGDLGRYRDDGNIEFMGRADFQLKIRGMRIEAGEIERAIEQCEGVRAAVVVASGEGTDKRLVAHVVRAGAEDGKGALGAFLGDESEPDVIVRPEQRLAFKLEQRGLRRDLSDDGIALAGFDPEDADTIRRWEARGSHRSFSRQPIPAAAFGAWMGSLAQLSGAAHAFPKYRYPSAGGLYPVQVHLYLKPGSVEGFAPGYHYYDPRAHRLQRLGDDDRLASAYRGYLAPLAEASGFSVFFVGALSAVAPMYGRLARDFCLLEAGYLGQLLMEDAPSRGIGLCPIGMLDDRDLRDSLRLREDDVIVHSMLGGAIGAEVPAQRSLSLHESIRERLTSTLPAHMIPTRIVIRDSLPLTANGKIDRRTLAALEDEQAGVTADSASRAPIAPDSDTERMLCAIVGDQLGALPDGNSVPDVSANFFELGADSIHLVKIHAAVSRRVQVPLAVTDFFAHPTIRGLAAYIDAAIAENAAGVGPREHGNADSIDRRAQRKRAVVERPPRGTA